MPWSVSCGPDSPQMMLVTYSGVVTGEELRAATQATAALGHEHHVATYLADGTAVSRVPRDLQLLSLDETARLSRGWLVKIFDRHDAAIAWLGVQSRAV